MIKNEKHNIKRTIGEIVRAKKRFPNLQEMCDKLNYSEDQVRKYMEALVQDGYLEKIGSWYRYPKQEKDTKMESLKALDRLIDGEDDEFGPVTIVEEPDTIDSSSLIPIIKETDVKIGVDKSLQDKPKKIGRPKGTKNKKEKKDEVRDDTIPTLAIYTIRVAMLITGIGSIIISIFYNTKLAMDFLPPLLAVIAGSIFVIFSVFAFEAIILFIAYKKIDLWKRIAVVFGLGSLWVTVALLSMASVVQGRYDRYMTNQQVTSADSRTINVGRLKWENIQERKKNLISIINDKRSKVKKLEKISSNVKDIKDREDHGKAFVDTEWRINLAGKEIEKYVKKLDEVREEETKHLELNPESTSADAYAGSYADFYEWLSTILGIPKEKIHFFISLLPAFFFDAVSPIAISFFLFLRKL